MTSEAFKSQILQIFYRDMHSLEQNNYSARRYSFDGVDRSQIFDVEKHTSCMNWFMETYQDVFDAWSKLSDQASRDLYVDLIRYKLAGHLHVRIRSRVQHAEEEAGAFKAAFTETPSTIALAGMFGQLAHHEGSWRGVDYSVDTIPGGMRYALVYGQYFFDRAGLSIKPMPNDHVVDAGAFTGDSSVIFSRSVGAGGQVYAFDPVEKHLEVCRLNFSRPGCENITLFPFGVGEKSVDAPLIQVSEYKPGYRAGSSDVPVPLRRIDDLVIDGAIPRIDFLKMDVEGSEMEALRGAKSSLHRFRPKLAISIYHKPNDFFDIINYIHGLNLGYSLYLDHHTIYDEETVLYAAVM